VLERDRQREHRVLADVLVLQFVAADLGVELGDEGGVPGQALEYECAPDRSTATFAFPAATLNEYETSAPVVYGLSTITPFAADVFTHASNENDAGFSFDASGTSTNA
jgi:hypothetical protein